MPKTNCYDSVFCYDQPSCPLYETCQQLKAEKEAELWLKDKFLGNVENWNPTGLSGPNPEDTVDWSKHQPENCQKYPERDCPGCRVICARIGTKLDTT